MKAKLRYQFLNYGLLVFLALLALILKLTTSVSAFLITLVFLLWLFAPGFALAKIFRFELDKSLLGKFNSYLTAGFAYQFFLSFLAMQTGLTLDILIWINSILIFVLLVLSFVLELKRSDEPIPLEIIKWLKETQPMYWVFLAVAFLVLVVVSQVGAHMRGDPVYHLSLMRKIIEGGALTVDKLAYIKGHIDELYTFPVWHILMSEISKLSGAQIFSLWMELPFALSLCVILAWYYLFRQLFRKEFFALLSLVLFLIISFSYNGGKAFLYERLMVPDTFNMMIMIPLSFGLMLNYVFNENKSNYQNKLKLIIVGLLVGSMGIIHMIQYVYVMLGWWLSFAMYALTSYKLENFKLILKKYLLAGSISFVIIIPFLVLLQLKGNAVSGAVASFAAMTRNGFKYDSVTEFTEYGKIAIILLPLSVIFLKKERQFWLPLAFFALVPIIHWIKPIQDFFAKNLSYTLVNRLSTNVSWTFVVIAAISGLFLIIIDNIFEKLNKKIKMVFNAVLLLATIFFVIFTFVSPRITDLSSKILADKALFIEKNFVVLMILSLLLTLSIILLQSYKSKISDFFTFQEPRNKFTILLLSVLLLVFFIAPYLPQMKKKTLGEFFNNPRFFKEVRDPTDYLVNFTLLGGQPTINDIKKNISPKSVINTNYGYFLLPLMMDQNVPDYWSLADKEFGMLYEVQSTLENKLECLAAGKIEYLMIVGPKPSQINYYNRYPDYFQFVFQNQNTIMYKVDLTKIYSEGRPTIKFDKTKSCMEGTGR
jgi:hypothetical protein